MLKRKKNEEDYWCNILTGLMPLSHRLVARRRNITVWDLWSLGHRFELWPSHCQEQSWASC